MLAGNRAFEKPLSASPTQAPAIVQRRFTTDIRPRTDRQRSDMINEVMILVNGCLPSDVHTTLN
jgi:hypothetical protein